MTEPRERLTHDELLTLLVEECAEVIKAVTKCQRFGFDVDHGVGYGNNKDQLAKEMGELAAVAARLGLADNPEFNEAFHSKIERAEIAKAKYGRCVCVSGTTTLRGMTETCDACGKVR